MDISIIIAEHYKGDMLDHPLPQPPGQRDTGTAKPEFLPPLALVIPQEHNRVTKNIHDLGGPVRFGPAQGPFPHCIQVLEPTLVHLPFFPNRWAYGEARYMPKNL